MIIKSILLSESWSWWWYIFLFSSSSLCACAWMCAHMHSRSLIWVWLYICHGVFVEMTTLSLDFHFYLASGSTACSLLCTLGSLCTPFLQLPSHWRSLGIVKLLPRLGSGDPNSGPQALKPGSLPLNHFFPLLLYVSRINLHNNGFYWHMEKGIHSQRNPNPKGLSSLPHHRKAAREGKTLIK